MTRVYAGLLETNNCKTFSQFVEISNLEVRQLGDAGPDVLVRGPQHPEDAEQLVNLRISLKLTTRRIN